MLPTSYIEIANQALGHIGESDRITDPDEDSKPARAVKRAWNLTRLFVLAGAHWSFACRTVTLTMRAPLASWPIAFNRNAFPLPADLVEFIEIACPDYLEAAEDEFTFEGGPNGLELLTCDPGPITVRYVRDGADIEDPSRWPAAFIAAFVFYLAWQIADELAADKGRKDRALVAAEKALSKAKKANNRTKARRHQHSGAWVMARQRLGFIDRPPGVYS